MKLSSVKRKIERGLVGVFVVGLPLVYSYRLYNPYELPKLMWLLVGTWIFVILLLVRPGYRRGGDGEWKSRWVWILSVIWLGVLLVTSLVGLNPVISLMGSQFRYQGWLMWLLVVMVGWTVFRTRLKEGYWVRMLLISGVAVASYAVYQAGLLRLGIPVMSYEGRAVSTMGNPNYVAGWLVVVVPVILWGWVRAVRMRSLKLGVVMGASLGLVMGGMWAADSVAGWLVLGLMALVVGLGFLRGKSKMLWLVASVGLLLVSWFGVVNNADKIQRAYSPWDNQFIIWYEAGEAVVARPVVGYGLDNFAMVFPAEEWLYPVDNEHNLVLQIAVASGVLGVVLFGAVALLGWLSADTLLRYMIFGLLARSMFNPMSIAELTLLWILIGLAVRHKIGAYDG